MKDVLKRVAAVPCPTQLNVALPHFLGVFLMEDRAPQPQGKLFLVQFAADAGLLRLRESREQVAPEGIRAQLGESGSRMLGRRGRGRYSRHRRGGRLRLGGDGGLGGSRGYGGFLSSLYASQRRVDGGLNIRFGRWSGRRLIAVEQSQPRVNQHNAVRAMIIVRLAARKRMMRVIFNLDLSVFGRQRLAR